MMYQVRPGQSKPATAMVVPEQRSAVWQRAVTVLLDQAYIPQLLNESACFSSVRRRTTTRAGLKVQAMLDENLYPKGRKVSDKQLAAVHLHRDEFHGDWNYTILPNLSPS